MNNARAILLTIFLFLTPSISMASSLVEGMEVLPTGAVETAVDANDPLEPINRGIFEFNLILDTMLFRPVAEIYRLFLPEIAREGIHNALSNLGAPVVFINDVIQIEPERAMYTLGRFLINSTLGIAGLFDVASHMGLPYHSEDFGQTLATIGGFGSGPYLMLPILGPSNPRDLVGLIVDFLIDPFNYAARRYDRRSLIYIRTGVDYIDRRANSIEFADRIMESQDPYALYRFLYQQNRDFKIRNEVPDIEDTPSPETALE